jgi:hypothetical protein
VSRHRLSRRSFLKGIGGAAVALPFLDIMSGCSADERWRRGIASGARALNGQPKRFLVVFTGNGTENTMNQWWPTGGERDFKLSPILAPLEPHKAKLIIPEGIGMESSYHGPGDAHQRGMGNILTGTELLQGNFKGNDGQTAGYAGGVSADQVIAEHIGKSTKFRSLELSIQNTGVTVYARLSYLGSNQPLPPENNPFSAYKRIFGGIAGAGGSGSTDGEWIIQRRKSVLDAVLEDYGALNARVGAEDRQKLEAHLTALRDVESRLQIGVPSGPSCTPPAAAGAFDHNDINKFPDVARVQMDLMVMALACDLTRVGSIMFARANNNMIFPWLGISDGHHDLSHHGDGDAEANAKLVKINDWFAQQFAYLLGKLDSIPDGDGQTLLDNTIVLWVNEQGKGNNHSRKSMPWVIAGSGGGTWTTGRYVKYPDAPPHNNLLVSCLNAFGVEATTFGNPAYCTGALAGLG